MPEMIPLGWFHTVMGIIALVSGAFTLAKFREISLQTRSGQIYLAATLITAATALAVFQRGEFGPGHALAVLTLAALAVGTVAATTNLFGKFSRYVRALSCAGYIDSKRNAVAGLATAEIVMLGPALPLLVPLMHTTGRDEIVDNKTLAQRERLRNRKKNGQPWRTKAMKIGPGGNLVACQRGSLKTTNSKMP